MSLLSNDLDAAGFLVKGLGTAVDPGDAMAKAQTETVAADAVLAKILAPCLVGALPAAAAPLEGVRGYCTDLTSTTFLATATGGGALEAPVHCTGAAWRVG